jgi:two-component system sensor histidine kinase KdpD
MKIPFPDRLGRKRGGSSGLWQTRPYTGAVAMVLVTAGLAAMLDRVLPHANLSLLFLTGILIVSARAGLKPGLVASVLSFLAYNYFFTRPFFTLKVDDNGDVATLAFFLVVAAIAGNLAARMHMEMVQRKDSLQRISNLFEFGRRMSSAATTEQVLSALVEDLDRHLQCPIVVLLPDAGGAFIPRAWSRQKMELTEDHIKQAWSRGASGWVAVDHKMLIQLVTSSGRVGLVVLDHEQTGQSPLDLDLAKSLCDQAAVALDRTLLAADLERARVSTETERLRSALLSSLSHDLRTPLASVIGATSSLLEYGGTLSAENQLELLQTTMDEAKRLDRYIQNLLDMTRLGHGTLKLERNWVDLHDIIASAIGRLGKTEAAVQLRVDVAADIPLLWVHGALVEQALVNLLDNATRFSPPGGQIEITANSIGDTLRIEVCDQGIGIADEEKKTVFDMFYTANQGDRSKLKGTGLGLAICQGMIAAHGGTVSAHDGHNRIGTCMRIELPIGQAELT